MSNVLIYTTPTCPYCIQAKQFLRDNNIEFEELDISQDQSRAEEMIAKSGQMGVPVFDISGEIIVGLDKQKISRALGL